MPPKTGTSGNAQVYKVEGGTLALKRLNIVHLLLMPRSNRCMWVSAMEITYVDGSKAKIVDPATYRPTSQGPSKPIYDANTTYLNPQGQKVKFNPATNAWISE